MAAHAWTDDELTALCAGVLLHGEGDWTVIRDDPNFHALNALSTAQLSSHWEWVLSTERLIQDAIYSNEWGRLVRPSIAEYLQGYPLPPSESQLSTILESMVARAKLDEVSGTYYIPILVEVERQIQEMGPLTEAGVVDFIRQSREAAHANRVRAEALLESTRAIVARVQARVAQVQAGVAQEDEDSD